MVAWCRLRQNTAEYSVWFGYSAIFSRFDKSVRFGSDYPNINRTTRACLKLTCAPHMSISDVRASDKNCFKICLTKIVLFNLPISDARAWIDHSDICKKLFEENTVKHRNTESRTVQERITITFFFFLLLFRMNTSSDMAQWCQTPVKQSKKCVKCQMTQVVNHQPCKLLLTCEVPVWPIRVRDIGQVTMSTNQIVLKRVIAQAGVDYKYYFQPSGWVSFVSEMILFVALGLVGMVGALCPAGQYEETGGCTLCAEGTWR